jgi:hypothetical protein
VSAMVPEAVAIALKDKLTKAPFLEEGLE